MNLGKLLALYNSVKDKKIVKIAVAVAPLLIPAIAAGKEAAKQAKQP